MTNNNLYFEPKDGSKGWYNHGDPKGKGKGKGKGYGTGSRYNPVGTNPQNPSNIPILNSGGTIQLFTLMELEHPGTEDYPFKTVPYKTPTV